MIFKNLALPLILETNGPFYVKNVMLQKKTVYWNSILLNSTSVINFFYVYSPAIITMSFESVHQNHLQFLCRIQLVDHFAWIEWSCYELRFELIKNSAHCVNIIPNNRIDLVDPLEVVHFFCW